MVGGATATMKTSQTAYGSAKFEPDTLITFVDKGYVPVYGGQRQKLKTPRH